MKYCNYCKTFFNLRNELICLNGKSDKTDNIDEPMQGDYKYRHIFQYLCPTCGSVYQGIKK